MIGPTYSGDSLGVKKHEQVIVKLVGMGATVHIEPDTTGPTGRLRYCCSANLGTMYVHWYHEYEPMNTAGAFDSIGHVLLDQQHRQLVQYMIERGHTVAIRELRGNDYPDSMVMLCTVHGSGSCISDGRRPGWLYRRFIPATKGVAPTPAPEVDGWALVAPEAC